MASVFGPPQAPRGFYISNARQLGELLLPPEEGLFAFHNGRPVARPLFSPAVREAFSSDSEKLLSSCGLALSQALHFNQGRSLPRLWAPADAPLPPSLPSIPRALPLARAGEPGTDVTAGVPSPGPGRRRPSGGPPLPQPAANRPRVHPRQGL